jgi:hypothetical protein
MDDLPVFAYEHGITIIATEYNCHSYPRVNEHGC